MQPGALADLADRQSLAPVHASDLCPLLHADYSPSSSPDHTIKSEGPNAAGQQRPPRHVVTFDRRDRVSFRRRPQVDAATGAFESRCSPSAPRAHGRGPARAARSGREIGRARCRLVSRSRTSCTRVPGWRRELKAIAEHRDKREPGPLLTAAAAADSSSEPIAAGSVSDREAPAPSGDPNRAYRAAQETYAWSIT